VRLTWLTRLLQDGLAFLSGVPAQETALLEAITFGRARARDKLRLTFDVRSVRNPRPRLFRSRARLHTDNPYRDPVPDFRRCTP